MVFFLKPGKTRNSNFRSYQIRLTCLFTLINPPILDTRSTDPLHTRSLPPPSPLLSPCVIIRRLHWCRFHAVINNGARNGIEEACPRKNNEKRKEKEKERGGIRNKGAEAGPFERIRSDRPFVTVRARVSVPFRESFHPWPSRISRNKSTGDRSCAEDYSLAAKGQVDAYWWTVDWFFPPSIVHLSAAGGGFFCIQLDFETFGFLSSI